jgi:WD40 repeat protein
MVLRGHVRSHEGQVHCVKLYDDCNYAASFGQDAKIVTYDMQRRRVQHEIATRHHGAILCGDISPDLKFMLSGGMDGHLFLWNLETREKLCTMGTRPKDKTRKHRAMHERVLDDAKPWEIGKAPWPGGKLHLGAVKCTAFVKETPTNRLISGGWDTKLLVWDLDSYASFTELDGHTGRITGCATSYETRYCCTVSEDKDVRIWDLQDKTCTKVVKGHKGKIFSCDVSSWAIYEPLLLTCGADGELNMWDMRRQEIRDALEGHYDSCLACAITEDGKCGISVSQDGLVRAWRTRSMLELHITYMVGEAGSGVYIEFKISVDPRDDVHSAKEQFRILTSTPIAYDKEGEPTYEVKDAKYRGLSPDEQAWTALVDGRKRILEKDDKRLETYGLSFLSCKHAHHFVSW